MSKYVQKSEWGKKYPNFQEWEFRCPCCGSIGYGIATTLLDTLQDLRNKKGKAITISSGYRCAKYNKKVGGIGGSKHTTGQAADFYFNDGSLANQNTRVALVNELKKTKYYGYAYCNVNNNYPNMGSAIHLDTKLIDTTVDKKKDIIKSLQKALNSDYKCGLDVDGIIGVKTTQAVVKNYLYNGKKAPNHTKWLQTRLKDLGYSIGSYGVDGVFENDTLNALEKFQKDKGLKVDGILGIDTTKKLIG